MHASNVMMGHMGGDGAIKPVDLVHLTRHTLGDRKLEQEILTLFVRQSTLFVERLKNAKSIAERSATAHTIKGSARGIGAWRVAELAAEVENPTGQATGDTALGALEAAISETNAYIADIADERLATG